MDSSPPPRTGDAFQFGADNSVSSSFSSPFDWSDEQLRGLIEGDNVVGGDHVVPYPCQSERNFPAPDGNFIINQYDSKASNIKPVDRKKPVDLHNFKHLGNGAIPASAIVLDSFPDLSWSNTTITNQSLSCALESNSTADGTGKLNSDPGFFQKLDGNIANMEILDDLDKILSNDDPVFCQTSLPSTQKLGLVSTDVTTVPEKSIPLIIDPPCVGLRAWGRISDKSETKVGHMQVQNQHWTRDTDNMNDFITPNISQTFPEPFVKKKMAVYTGGKAPAFSMQFDSGFTATPESSLGRVFWEDHSRQEEQEQEANQLQDLSRYWPISFDKINNPNISTNQSSPSVVLPQPVPFHYNPLSTSYSSLVLPQPMQLRYNLESMTYPCHELSPSVSMDFASQYTMPFLSRFHDEQSYQQTVPCSSYVSPHNHSNSLKNISDRPVEDLAMSPRKKIEKLRRQQQMRAMVAIQKLQQQFRNQVVSTDHSVMACENFFVKENSRLEQNDSDIVSVPVDDHTAESILHQLKEIILMLDTSMKLNIRDSLFRLAQNARHRHYANNNTSSMNTYSNTAIANKQDINSKVEIETNQIDRAVAHLLFHQPPELTDTPEFQSYKKFRYESKPTGSLNFAR